MAKTIILPPAGASTPEGSARIRVAMADADALTIEVANAAESFLVRYSEDIRHALTDTDEKAEFESLENLIERRADAQYELRCAVSGRKNNLEVMAEGLLEKYKADHADDDKAVTV